MADLETLFRAVDALQPEELEQLREYIEQRRRNVKWWAVPPENLEKVAEAMQPVQQDAANMSVEEINTAIDEAIAEARRELQ